MSACSSATAWTAAAGTWLPQQFDASILSDEATAPGPAELHRRLRRHGLPGHGRRGPPADFDWFDYATRDYRPDPRS